MLKQRLVSGLGLAVVMLAIIIWLPTAWVAIAMAVLFLAGGWEWGKLTSVSTPSGRWAWLALLTAWIGLLWYFRDTSFAWYWLLVALAGWLAAVVLLAGYQQNETVGPRWQLLLGAAGLLALPAAWLAFVSLHAMHFGWLLYIMVLCTVADSFAYLFGKRYGKRKLAPELSPGKTREGMLGGILGVFMLAVITMFMLDWPAASRVSFILLSLLAGLLSVTGDLFESLMKREARVKDSGKVLPGHGGVLDRFDSHIAAAPLFFVGLGWIMN